MMIPTKLHDLKIDADTLSGQLSPEARSLSIAIDKAEKAMGSLLPSAQVEVNDAVESYRMVLSEMGDRNPNRKAIHAHLKYAQFRVNDAVREYTAPSAKSFPIKNEEAKEYVNRIATALRNFHHLSSGGGQMPPSYGFFEKGAAPIISYCRQVPMDMFTDLGRSLMSEIVNEMEWVKEFGDILYFEQNKDRVVESVIARVLTNARQMLSTGWDVASPDTAFRAVRSGNGWDMLMSIQKVLAVTDSDLSIEECENVILSIEKALPFVGNNEGKFLEVALKHAQSMTSARVNAVKEDDLYRQAMEAMSRYTVLLNETLDDMDRADEAGDYESAENMEVSADEYTRSMNNQKQMALQLADSRNDRLNLYSMHKVRAYTAITNALGAIKQNSESISSKLSDLYEFNGRPGGFDGWDALRRFFLLEVGDRIPADAVVVIEKTADDWQKRTAALTSLLSDDDMMTVRSAGYESQFSDFFDALQNLNDSIRSFVDMIFDLPEAEDVTSYGTSAQLIVDTKSRNLSEIIQKQSSRLEDATQTLTSTINAYIK